MKVRDLIEKLTEMPEYLDVVFDDGHGVNPVIIDVEISIDGSAVELTGS